MIKLNKDVGHFIVIEGPDGSGKTTISQMLVDHLNQSGYDAVYMHDPGSSSLGEKIRELVLSEKLTHNEYIMLFSAGLNYTLRNAVIPALLDKKIVIMDRYLRSSYIYQQIYARSASESWENYNIRKKLFESISKALGVYAKPEYEFVLDINPSVAIQRMQTRNKETDVWEGKGLSYLTSIINLYSKVEYGDPFRINANLSEREVLTQITNILEQPKQTPSGQLMLDFDDEPTYNKKNKMPGWDFQEGKE